jgi:hypothetical protein
MKHQVDCIEFKPYRKNTLVGFADISIPELRLVIHDVTLHEKAGALGRAPVQAMGQGRRARHRRDRQAAIFPIVEFDGRETRDAFSAAVWRAVLAHNTRRSAFLSTGPP